MASPPDWSDVLRPSVQFVRLLWCDAAGIRRCRVIPRRRLEEAARQGVGLAYACFWMPAWGDCCIDDPAGAPVGEMRLVPDASATRVLPWMPSHAIALVTMCKVPPDEPWRCCPRTALKRVLAQVSEKHGLSIRLGFELEYYLLRQPQKKEGCGCCAACSCSAGASSAGADGSGMTVPPLPEPIDGSNYCSSTAFEAAAPVLAEMCSCLASLGVPVDQLHAESGPGQFELATAPAPALQAADSLLLSQEGVAAVASKHGMLASFLPKLFERSAASGLHMHFSLWRKEEGAGQEGGEEEANLLAHEPPRPRAFVFAGSDEPAVPGLSATGEAFLAGVLQRLPALMAFTTPSPNSYRRLQPHCWAGAFQCFGVNNREAPLRLCSAPGAPASANCELKAFDATANPHLAAAAVIVAGLMGVEQGLRLPHPMQSDPGSLSNAAREAAGVRRLPSSLGEAVDAFEADEEFQAALASALGTATLGRAFMVTRRSEFAHFGEMSLEREAAALYARY